MVIRMVVLAVLASRLEVVAAQGCASCADCVQKSHDAAGGEAVPWCTAGFDPRACEAGATADAAICWCVDAEGAKVDGTRRAGTGNLSCVVEEADEAATCGEVGHFSVLDACILVLYFAGMIGVGWFVYSKEKGEAAAALTGDSDSAARDSEAGQDMTATDEFFLAGRSMHWFAVGLSLFVSNIGSEHLVGLSGSAAASGVAVGFFEWHASFALLVLGWVCAPIYLHNNIATLPEYLEKRYGSRARTVLAVTSLIAYVLSKLSVSVFSGATIAHVVFGIDKMVAAVGLILITSIYTVFGGLTAVILTDVAQSVVLLIGCITMLIVGLGAVGGLSGLYETVPPGLTAEEYEGFWHMARSADDPDYPWPGLYFGVNAIGLWYWCTDMAIAQRVLAAKNLQHARAACLFAAVLKITPVFIMCYPGIIARVLYGDCVAGERSNDTFALLIVRLLPSGVVGLLVAATLAAAMSSIDSVATAGASLFCLDIYRPFVKPDATEQQLVSVGRIVIGVMAILTIIWLPIITVLSDQVFVYIQSVQAYLSPPIFVAYFAGILWPRANEKGAMTCLGLGYGLGFSRLFLEIVFKDWCDTDGSGFFGLYICANYLYFGLISLVCCLAAMYFGSMSTSPPAPEKLDGLTYASAMAGIAAAENAQTPAGVAESDGEGVAAVGDAGSAWERANKHAGEHFSDLNKYGSALVVVVLAIMLVSFA